MKRLFAVSVISLFALGALARGDLVHHHLAVAGQPGERRVDLAERQGAAVAEPEVVVALEVVAVAGFTFEKPEKGQRHRHAGDYTPRVYVGSTARQG